MNVFIAILFFFSLLGLADKLSGGKLGLKEPFEDGLKTMGSLCFSMAGIYCGAVWLTRQNIPFDFSALAGIFLAPDLGGYPMAAGFAKSAARGQFSGILVSSMLGCMISFVLPISLGLLKESERKSFMEGTILGIVTLPIGLIIGGFLLKMTLKELMICIFPVIIICVLLILGLKFIPAICIGIMNGLGKVISLIGSILFVILVFGLFVPQKAVFEIDLAGEALIVVLKITIIVCGSLVLNRILMKYCRGIFLALERKLDMNEESVMGLMISFATSISMLPLYADMDEKGKRANAAFSVGGAFCLGGQLAYVSAVTDARCVRAYLICKLICGISAVLLVNYQSSNGIGHQF